MTTIQLVLVDDWELRGNGTGDMRWMQFDTLRKLLAIYERHGLRASINAEIMQQLHHLEWGERFPELAALAEEWAALVKESYARGHDVQLHVHSQWEGARYEDGRWVLTADWSIANHSPEAARAMIRRCRDYLEGLLRPIDPSYRCVSFRSGQWCIAPSDHMLTVLAEEGFSFDMSIVGGLVYDTGKVRVDYRECEETFLPFFPDMKDARKVATAPSPIVCFPTFSFYETRSYMLGTVLARTAHVARRRLGLKSELPRRPDAMPVRGSGSLAADPYYGKAVAPVARRGVAQLLRAFLVPSHYHVADLSNLTFPQMRDMIGVIRRRAGRSGWTTVPVILENHTKDIGDFEPLEEFARYVAEAEDLEVLTLAEIHRNLLAGAYRPVVKAKA